MTVLLRKLAFSVVLVQSFYQNLAPFAPSGGTVWGDWHISRVAQYVVYFQLYTSGHSLLGITYQGYHSTSGQNSCPFGKIELRLLLLDYVLTRSGGCRDKLAASFFPG